MGEERKTKKGESAIEKYFFKGKTEEEIKAWRAASTAKANATRQAKMKSMADAKAKAQELLPHLLAQEMLLLDNENYVPPPEILEKVRKLLDDPRMTLERLRRDQFRQMSEKGWEKLCRFLFKDHVANEADLGLQIFEQRKEEVIRLEKRIRMITKEMKTAKKDAKKRGLPYRVSVGMLDLLIQCERDLRDYKADVNKNIYKTNMESSKAKASTSIHLHTTIPRPEARDITPPKKTLDDLVNGN